MKVFMNNWFILKSKQFYRQFKHGLQGSRRIEKGSVNRDLILKRVYSSGKKFGKT